MVKEVREGIADRSKRGAERGCARIYAPLGAACAHLHVSACHNGEQGLGQSRKKHWQAIVRIGNWLVRPLFVAYIFLSRDV